MSTLNPKWIFSDRFAVLFLGLVVTLVGCSTLPVEKHRKFSFPPEATFEDPTRPYEVIGIVRSRVDFSMLNPDDNETSVCQNYFNEAVQKLVQYGKEKKADAVIKVRSVVALVDGRTETHARAECADEGGEAQVLAIGTAIRYKKIKKER